MSSMYKDVLQLHCAEWLMVETESYVQLAKAVESVTTLSEVTDETMT